MPTSWAVSYTHLLDKALKLLHPFMPFITEEIYQALPGSAETIMNEKWPGDENMKVWAEDCADFEKLMDYIKAVRADVYKRQEKSSVRSSGRRSSIWASISLRSDWAAWWSISPLR